MAASSPESRPVLAADVAGRLRAAGCVYAEEEAALLVQAAADEADLEGLVARRAAGEPLEVVLGWAEFCGLRVVVRPGVFVPRRRSELLVERAASGLRSGQVVVDLCCGTGALGLAVAHAVPGVEVHAADLDPAAVECARENLGALGEAYQGDLYDALPARLRGWVDALVVNAPYVPSDEVALMPPEARDHEPAFALDGGVDGLDVHRRVAAAARDWLMPGGRVLIEVAERQLATARELLEGAGLSVRAARDPDRSALVLEGSRPG